MQFTTLGRRKTEAPPINRRHWTLITVSKHKKKREEKKRNEQNRKEDLINPNLLQRLITVSMHAN